MYDFSTQNLITGQVTPAGMHDEGHALKGKWTDIVAEGYHWVQKQLNGPGAMNYAFETLALNKSTAIGPGVRQRQFWATVATPLFVETMGRPTSGYGGVAQGQVLSQPLFDPYNNTYGNIQG